MTSTTNKRKTNNERHFNAVCACIIPILLLLLIFFFFRNLQGLIIRCRIVLANYMSLEETTTQREVKIIIIHTNERRYDIGSNTMARF